MTMSGLSRHSRKLPNGNSPSHSRCNQPPTLIVRRVLADDRAEAVRLTSRRRTLAEGFVPEPFVGVSALEAKRRACPMASSVIAMRPCRLPSTAVVFYRGDAGVDEVTPVDVLAVGAAAAVADKVDLGGAGNGDGPATAGRGAWSARGHREQASAAHRSPPKFRAAGECYVNAEDHFRVFRDLTPRTVRVSDTSL
jgi:hypothetical protein